MATRKRPNERLTTGASYSGSHANPRRKITASANPNLVGNVYVVAAAHEKDWQTAQRLLVDHDAGPS